MISANRNYCWFRIIFIIPVVLLYSVSMNLNAQEPPPRPIRIDVTAQGLSFGAFYHGAGGGTVVIPLLVHVLQPVMSFSLVWDIPFSAALFQVHAHRGTVISILNGPDALLTGVPSGTMTLHIRCIKSVVTVCLEC